MHLNEFTELFTQVVRLAREMGQVKLGTIAVDGTKIKANASRHKAMSYARMQTTETELKAQIAEPPNGWIKSVLGFRQFSMRGLEKAQAEFKLECMALNLRKMVSMQMA